MTLVRAALVLAAVVNGPAAVPLVVGLPGGRRAAVTAVGLAAAAVGAAAALSGPLLDALDVGVPSAQISAGALAAVGGLLAFVNGSWGELARDGRSGLVVPLVVPALAGPGPLAVAVALAARHGTATALAAAAVAAAVTLALVVWTPRRPWGPPLAARLLGAAALAGAVELAVEGVLGV